MTSVLQNKLEKRLRHQVGKAIMDYQLIEENDKIMVCLSGGKDSYSMLDILLNLKNKAPVNFEIVAVNLDQNQPGFPKDVLPNYLKSRNISYKILMQDTYSVVKELIPAGKTMCSLCSRLRRGALYKYAKENGFSKIALGHHKNDVIETLFMNMFFGGTLKAIPPKLKSDDKQNIIIRPLYYCSEIDLIKYAKLHNFPIIPCNLCGSQEGLQRQEIKQLLQKWEEQYPGRTENIFRSITRIKPSQLADLDLFDFQNLQNSTECENIYGNGKGNGNWLA